MRVILSILAHLTHLAQSYFYLIFIAMTSFNFLISILENGLSVMYVLTSKSYFIVEDRMEMEKERVFNSLTTIL